MVWALTRSYLWSFSDTQPPPSTTFQSVTTAWPISATFCTGGRGQFCSRRRWGQRLVRACGLYLTVPCSLAPLGSGRGSACWVSPWAPMHCTRLTPRRHPCICGAWPLRHFTVTPQFGAQTSVHWLVKVPPTQVFSPSSQGPDQPPHALTACSFACPVTRIFCRAGVLVL